eukprot:TRINITY_DN5991_c0_g3_i12.p1 TRINITY_DN5991_c0_g3~~TRINITY_DN5991_c0_g3_i12.p1  ORF type:complete len:610 (+),score=120.46 TRINITY_DN5991_c0_g3_i12:50-1879(+)
MDKAVILKTQIATLKTCVVDSNLLKAILETIRGNELLKSSLGKECGSEIVQQAHPDSPFALEAVNVLRSITCVDSVRKHIGSKCSLLFSYLQQAIQKFGKSPDSYLKYLEVLTASCWNLAVRVSNTTKFLKCHSIIPTLEKQVLSSPPTSVLTNETLGFLKSLALSVEATKYFVSSSLVEIELGLLSKLPHDCRATSSILYTLRALKLPAEKVRQLMKPEFFGTFTQLITSTQGNPELLVLVLQALLKLLENADYKAIPEDTKFKSVLVSLSEGGTNKKVISLSTEIIDLLGKAWPSSQPSDFVTLQQKLSNSSIKRKKVKELATGLLQELALEDSIRPKDVVLTKIIGEGAFGQVWLAKYNGHPVAVKMIKKNFDEKSAKGILKELSFMINLKHPNVCMLMGAYFNEANQTLIIVTEFCTNRDLKYALSKVDNISLQWKMCQDACKGLNWLQTYHIVHRDLKLENLLVSEDWTVKVSDFGVSVEVEEGSFYDRFGGNVKYSAPEILAVKYPSLSGITTKKYPYGEKTDVFSFGLLWYQILTKKDPYHPLPPDYQPEDKTKKIEMLAKYIIEHHVPVLPSSWPQSFRTLLGDCWSLDPQKRSDPPLVGY